MKISSHEIGLANNDYESQPESNSENLDNNGQSIPMPTPHVGPLSGLAGLTKDEQRAGLVVLSALRKGLSISAQKHMLKPTAEKETKIIPAEKLTSPVLRAKVGLLERERLPKRDSRLLKYRLADDDMSLVPPGHLWTKHLATTDQLWHMSHTDNKWISQVDSIDRLSAENISRLRNELLTERPLNEMEGRFLRNFTEQKFYASHFTTADPVNPETSVASLYSRQKLIGKKDIGFSDANSTMSDIKWARNDDYVFFSLECGDIAKKQTSAFGSTLMRFNIDQPQFSHAWLSMNDMYKPRKNTMREHLPNLDEEDYEKAQANVYTYNRSKYVFSGRHMIPGVGLSLIHAIRGMSDKAQTMILGAESEFDLNKVMNGMFRPELKVPRHLITADFQKIQMPYASSHDSASPSTPSEDDLTPWATPFEE
ncbi:hypothetical protein L2Y90_21680 [Burkholderia pyrrocinia]|uniref:hypothetical protein n=1 Tax=Burkholderia pyrrocinia TaxID=60550 RepID=UPI00215B6A32|nr:hypothetical protein [Burkholderia pyrrocinia]UVE69348.1 hypothetical protein L2Y90_21680 [Burkholderia pyrrocinia]